MDNEKDTKTYTTDCFYPAVFLLAKGYELLAIDKTNRHRCLFTFQDREDREGILNAYYFAPKDDKKVLVDVRSFVAGMRALRDKLYEDDKEKIWKKISVTSGNL